MDYGSEDKKARGTKNYHKKKTEIWRLYKLIKSSSTSKYNKLSRKK